MTESNENDEARQTPVPSKCYIAIFLMYIKMDHG
jgi:hypothetical protein